MALTTTVSGIMTIGTATKIPISTTLPPAKAGEFEFSYAATDINAATKLPVGEFIGWAASQLESTTKATDLPASLRTLNIAVEKLNFDTKGKFDIKVQIGKVGDDQKWDATWKPIDSLPFTLSDITLEFNRVP